MILLALIALALGMLHGCGGGGSSTQSPASAPPSPPEDAPVWTQESQITGVCCSYAPIVVQGHTLRVYSNTPDDSPGNAGTSGDYWLRQGNMLGVDSPVRVLHISDPTNGYIRTSAVVVADGTYHAIMQATRTYDGPGHNGYTPLHATSVDGVTWTVPVEIGLTRWQDTGTALTYADGKATLYLGNYAGHKIAALTSTDWRVWELQGEVVPPGLPDDAQWVTAARTPYGTHLIYANHFPAQQMRHLWACPGGKFRVLEMDAPLRNASGKGIALAYDAGIIHGVALGAHWSTTARGWTC